MSTAENATQENPPLTMEEKLDFIATQAKTHNLSPEFVFEVMKNHACAEARAMEEDPFDKIIRMFQENLPLIATLLQQKYGEKAVKVFKRISIENEDKSIFTPETIKLKKGDLVKLKLPEETFTSTILEYDAEAGEAFGRVNSELTNTEKHGVKRGEMVCFTHSHIFAYKAISPEEAARQTATAAPEENLVDVNDIGYDILKHNAPAKDESLECTAKG